MSRAAQAQQIEAGYKAYNGHQFSQAEAEAYNRFTAEIEVERWAPTHGSF